MKTVLIIGAGGREHALALAFARSQQVATVYVAPGNPGMVKTNDKIECVNIAVTDIEALTEFVQLSNIDITFVGPEQPLELGIVDHFKEKNLAIVGPTQLGAQLENSKNFAKEIMNRSGVKTAKYQFFNHDQCNDAMDYARKLGIPFVIKADGLMNGKGVVIPETMEEAIATLELMMEKNKKSVLIEEFLEGTEMSHFSLVNGEHIIPIGSACDYKRVLENDKGLNTGGMGAFAPVPWFGEDAEQQILKEIIQPVAKQMVDNQTPFSGVLYTGVIWTKDGPKVIEFNTRFGDPETQVLLPLIENDFYDVVNAHLNKIELQIQLKQTFNLGIVLAAAGYPNQPKSNIELNLPDNLEENIIYAGVKEGHNTELVSNGGRVLMITDNGNSINEARTKAYQLMDTIKIPDTFYRCDIGFNREKENSIMKKQTEIAIVMGSISDWEQMKHCCDFLDSLNLPYDTKVISAHRMPQEMIAFAESAADTGYKVIVAGAGGAAHLPGMIASSTTLPVIGVPIKSSTLNGMDSLLSIVQMPAGVPVATMAIGTAGAKNAALMAARILALTDDDARNSLEAFQMKQKKKAIESNGELNG